VPKPDPAPLPVAAPFRARVPPADLDVDWPVAPPSLQDVAVAAAAVDADADVAPVGCWADRRLGAAGRGLDPAPCPAPFLTPGNCRCS